jgi:hypothetical protein
MNRSKKKASAPKRSGVVPSSIRLPKEMHDWVSKQPGGFTDTIKRAVELLQSFESEDEDTRTLVAAVFGIARDVERITGKKWHSDNLAFVTFESAMKTAVFMCEPEDHREFYRELMARIRQTADEDARRVLGAASDTGFDIANDVLAMPDPVVRERVRASRTKANQVIRDLKDSEGDETND